MQKISFIEYQKKISLLNCAPTPATKCIPEWYKKALLFCSKDDKVKNCPHLNSSAPNTTYKNCAPFLDALSTGYIFKLPVDVQFTLKETGSIEWNTRLKGNFTHEIGEIVTLHSFDQYPNLPNLNDVYEKPLVFKWQSGYSIKTPKGYSSLFTHPFNRYELPFRVLTGVVDTDTYNNEVLFPFQITHKFKKPGEIIIVEAGTPIAQVLPFKRVDWKSEITGYNQEFKDSCIMKYFSKILNAYKSRYWNKKIYD